MATTTRRKTTKTTDIMSQTFETVAISDVCTQNKLSEQTFRLALMEFQPNDFDSVKAIPVTVAEQVLATITATSKALPATEQPQLEPTATPENPTPQELQPAPPLATEQPQKPQNSSIATSTPKAISSPATGANIPTALTEFIAKAQDDIELFDLVNVYRNEQILTNSESRDSELVLKLREQRLENRSMVFDQLRDLNSRQPVAQELPELPQSLSDEIKALSDELGKQLNRAA
ncbi:hypothetical protein [Dolichospermum sp. UHCC 0259]|uniref:hypothetical protein n=1 Tax=Dolichospermum sp. UHCC 0259 TaxID=2590010 RepID=UPI00144580AD|nr:hypothetical protein [Dolichospermum sp. UHCC 0259]MTJ48173.1 hypothetical protein [Dolichospermum sp. UHCC 0259]